MCFVCAVDNIILMENIIHGANPENLYRALNIKMPEKILDFSTNTNILSYSNLTWPSININLEKLASNYPDSDCRKLRELISIRENINPERILFTNGINEAIFLLSQIFSCDSAILQPCYSEYSRAFTNAESIFTLETAGKFKCIVITNPNNPTGKYIPDLSRVIAKFPDTVFIIDEAYIDFLIDDNKPEKLHNFENAIILRSLTKIFHLSGVRIGYVIANENIIHALKARQPSWSVNSVAQELAYLFLQDSEFYRDTRNFYRKNTPEFVNMLKASGFEVNNSSVHFFLVRVDDDLETIKFLLRNGIVVRHTRNFAGFDGKYIRVATRRPDENKFFVDILCSALQPPPPLSYNT